MDKKKLFFSGHIAYLAILYLILCISWSCTGDKNLTKTNNDLEKFGLKGQVKTLTEKEYPVLNKTGEGHGENLIRKIIMHFNPSGYLLERTVSDSSGNVTLKETCEYDINDKCIRSYEYSKFKTDVNKKTTTYKYNEKGQEIEADEENDNGSLSIRHITIYDRAGNIVERNSKWPDGSLMARTVFKNDRNGNKIEAAYYHNGNEPEYKDRYEYDKYGNDTTIRRYDSSGNLTLKFVHQFSEQNKLIRNTSYRPDGKISMELLISYDSEGHEIGNYFMDYNNNRDKREITKYNPDGNIVERTTYENGKFSGSFNYSKFDKSGNYQRLLIVFQDESTVAEREIEYF